MSNNVKDTNNTGNIDRRVYLVRDSEKCKMNKIDWCEVGMSLSGISTKNVRENKLNPRIKYMMVSL